MTEADYTILGENIARLLDGQHAINTRLDRMLDEHKALRNEMRRMAENQLIAPLARKRAQHHRRTA